MRQRKRCGQAIAELGGAMVLVIPVMVIFFYACSQGVQAYFIYCTLKDAANRASRALAIAYMRDPAATLHNYNHTLAQIEAPGVVNSYQQFDSVVFNTNSCPATVSLRVTFMPYNFGCTNFPQPDILGVGRYFTISAQASHTLD